MTDKELIQALRCDNGNCLICGLCDSCFNIDAEVADRLEALLEENERRKAGKDTNVPTKWVSMEEQMPRYNRDVLCYRPEMAMENSTKNPPPAQTDIERLKRLMKLWNFWSNGTAGLEQYLIENGVTFRE